MALIPAQSGNPASPRQAYVNARVFDPSSGLDEKGGLVVEHGVIAEVGTGVTATQPPDTNVIDCQGHLLIPGLIDMQVFSGEPGFEHLETLGSASAAAAAGGVTTIICKPNTQPVIDDVALVDFLERRARDTAMVNVHTMAALTKNLEGCEITEIGLLKAAGAVAFSDGPSSIQSATVFRRVLSYANDFGALVIHHVEDSDLAANGVMHDSEAAMRLGLPGISDAAEVIMLERDIRLVELTGARYHAAQISCAKSVDVMRAAKARGLAVTCGVSANHLVLNEHDVGTYRTFFKLSPPLRSEEDRQALVAGLSDGTIDVIVSNHEPQDIDGKRRPFAEAAFGAVGLETLLAASLMLYHEGDVGLGRIIASLSCTPARLLGLDRGRLCIGAPADFVTVDLGMPWVLNVENLKSKCQNTAFEDRKLQGHVMMTIVAGRCVHQFEP
jgi:dihydroorotase